MTTNIYHNENLIAQFFDFNLSEEVQFPTPEQLSFQVGYGDIKLDKLFNSHIHKRVNRTLDNTSEFLYVIHGEITINILAEDKSNIKTIIIGPQMGFLQFYGGHSIFIKANTRYFEIKQGPYLGKNSDKFEI